MLKTYPYTTYLFQAHQFDHGTPLEETLRTFDDLVRVGKVRYIGVSNFNGWQMQSVVDTAKTLGINPIVSLQVRPSSLSKHLLCIWRRGRHIFIYLPPRRFSGSSVYQVSSHQILIACLTVLLQCLKKALFERLHSKSS